MQQDFHFRVNYPAKVKYVFHVIVGKRQTLVLKLQYQKSINRLTKSVTKSVEHTPITHTLKEL